MSCSEMNLHWEALTEATCRAIGELVNTTVFYPLDACKSKYRAEVKSQTERKYSCGLQANNKIKELAISIEGKSLEEKKTLLANCAVSTISSKLIGGEKEFFANMVVDAVISIGNDDKINMIGIKKVTGGAMHDSFIVGR